ncbi:MAG: hypothetical protein GXP25_09150 [Planctomycetes bacterium]|nr:hypothetical protein [Planctomycetota bacterium]
MKMTRTMRKRVRSLTRKQLLAYLFMSAEDLADEQSLGKLNSFEMGSIVISWGYHSDPKEFPEYIRKVKDLARSEDERFQKFYLDNTEFEDVEPAES